VQGVNYRSSARNIAEQLRITGTVRNVQSGEVEAIVTGDPEQVHAFIEWAKKGPAMARVDDIVVEESSYQPFDGFTITR